MECFKWGLMSKEDSGTGSDLNCGPRLKRSQWRIILLCGIEIILGIFLVKNVAAFALV